MENLQIFYIMDSFSFCIRLANGEFAVCIFCQKQFMCKLRKFLVGMIFVFSCDKSNYRTSIILKTELFFPGQISGDNCGANVLLNIFEYQAVAREVINMRWL